MIFKPSTISTFLLGSFLQVVIPWWFGQWSVASFTGQRGAESPLLVLSCCYCAQLRAELMASWQILIRDIRKADFLCSCCQTGPETSLQWKANWSKRQDSNQPQGNLDSNYCRARVLVFRNQLEQTIKMQCSSISYQSLVSVSSSQHANSPFMSIRAWFIDLQAWKGCWIIKVR